MAFPQVTSMSSQLSKFCAMRRRCKWIFCNLLLFRKTEKRKILDDRITKKEEKRKFDEDEELKKEQSPPPKKEKKPKKKVPPKSDEEGEAKKKTDRAKSKGKEEDVKAPAEPVGDKKNVAKKAGVEEAKS